MLLNIVRPRAVYNPKMKDHQRNFLPLILDRTQVNQWRYYGSIDMLILGHFLLGNSLIPYCCFVNGQQNLQIKCPENHIVTRLPRTCQGTPAATFSTIDSANEAWRSSGSGCSARGWLPMGYGIDTSTWVLAVVHQNPAPIGHSQWGIARNFFPLPRCSASICFNVARGYFSRGRGTKPYLVLYTRLPKRLWALLCSLCLPEHMNQCHNEK